MIDEHEANRKRWDAGSEKWAKGADSRGLWRRCPSEPELVLSDQELEYVADISGKRVCVLGSGDNQVAFALAGLGGIVTSVDISQKQLDVAERRTQELDLSISFMRADVTDLSVIDSGTFEWVSRAHSWPPERRPLGEVRCLILISLPVEVSVQEDAFDRVPI